MKLIPGPFLEPKFAADGKTALPRVKICGITNERDALDAIALGADALGFNLYTQSKRFVDLDVVAGWMQSLPADVTKVAVMVNPSVAEAESIFKLPFFDMVQFHGDEDGEFCAHFARLGLPFIKAVAVKDGASLDNLERFRTQHILLDAWSQGAYGGTGRMIDRGVLRRLGGADAGNRFKVILAGGLDAGNVRDAVELAHPHAVDVASGVESAPGRKDKALMREFIRAVSGGES